MSKKLSDLLVSHEANVADTLLDFYDGKQEKHMINLLNDPSKGRKEWQARGIIPRTRNILKMIVDKSGLLFNDKAPVLDVYTNDSVDEEASARLLALLEEIDWVEFFTNLDPMVRMLKTCSVLVQWDNESDELVFDVLTRQNSYVELAKNNRSINTLIYITNPFDCNDKDSVQEFRVITPELIQDFTLNKNGQEALVASMPNPFGIVPLVAFNDTNVPRVGYWNHAPSDLFQINQMYNLHITDSEYAASWSKLQTLFTNATISNNEESSGSSVGFGSPFWDGKVQNNALIGGPARVVQLDTSGVDGAFVEYKGPQVTLGPIDDMFNKWVADFAADWSVNVKNDNSVADSGFKLVVEEMPNLELRKKRARMFEAGFKRLYQVITVVVNNSVPGFFPEDSELFVTFASPKLPIDAKVSEDIWSAKIAAGRASRVDYFMYEQGLTKEQAIEKMAEIDAERANNPVSKTPTTKVSATV